MNICQLEGYSGHIICHYKRVLSSRKGQKNQQPLEGSRDLNVSMVSEASNNTCDSEIGSRIECDGHRATVLFKGHVPPTKGEWLGVEWDDPSRGKHDGTYEGTQYFKTRHPKSGSFIRQKKALPGQDFMRAVIDRYGELDDENAGVLQEEMFVVGGGKVTTVEVVGAQKLNRRQGQLEYLLEVAVRGQQISTAGDIKKIAKCLPSVQELDVSANLIPAWTELAKICGALPNLQILNISEDRLKVPSQPSGLKEAFDSIRTVFGNRMACDWDFVLQMVQMIANLEKLHLCWNQISSIQSLSQNLNNLMLLNLESNPLDDWAQVMPLASLPKLEELLLNDCGLTAIDIGDASSLKPFPALTHLALMNNKLDTWKSINELGKMNKLTHLKIKENPITTATNKMSSDSIRYLIIAKIGSLMNLNSSEIEHGERLGAEVDYRKTYGKQWRESGGHQDASLNKPSEDFKQQHPRYQALIEKYGAPEDSELKEQSSALKNNLISVTVKCPDFPEKKTLTKKIPVSMSVQKIKVLVQRLYKAPDINNISLNYSSKKMPEQEIEFENDLKEIGYYSIEEGDTILVRW